MPTRENRTLVGEMLAVIKCAIGQKGLHGVIMDPSKNIKDGDVQEAVGVPVVSVPGGQDDKIWAFCGFGQSQVTEEPLPFQKRELMELFPFRGLFAVALVSIVTVLTITAVVAAEVSEAFTSIVEVKLRPVQTIISKLANLSPSPGHRDDMVSALAATRM